MPVDTNAVARTVGIETTFKNLRQIGTSLLPQRIAVFGQGNTASTYSTAKKQVSSANEVGTLYGFGSPVHNAARQLLPANGDGVGSIPVTIYPLEDNGAGVAATGDITPGGAQTEVASYVVRINNIDSAAFIIEVGDTVAAICTAMTAAINSTLHMPVTAVDNTIDVQLTSKWKGASANDIYVEIIGSATAGTTFAVTQPAGGATNPDITAALALIGDSWETLVLNCLDVADTTTLGKFTTEGEARWDSLVRKPFVAFTGTTEATLATAITIPDARPTDRVNAQLVAPGSNDLPFVVAARQLARIAITADRNPPRDYGSQPATGLTPGTDGQQWTYTQRDQAVKAGSSTIQVKDGVVNLADIVTFYHPNGEEPPAYRYVVDIVKIQNILYNLDLIFESVEWDGAPLIPDSDPTINREAKKPKDAVAAVKTMIDNLGLRAIISDPATAKSTVTAQISDSNPKRLDVALTVQLSGNTNIIAISFDFGFFFGITPII